MLEELIGGRAADGVDDLVALAPIGCRVTRLTAMVARKPTGMPSVAAAAAGTPAAGRPITPPP